MERRHPLFDRITLDPNKCMGKPCIPPREVIQAVYAGVYE